MSETNPSSAPDVAVIQVDFVRHRNVLVMRADLGPLLVDYYLHLAEHSLRPDPEHDRLFKDGLAAFALHCASRPHGEHLAWTVNFQNPRLNLFYTGDNEDGLVAGRVFTDNVREAEHNIFFSEIMPRRGAEKRRSVVSFDGADFFSAAEAFYASSEQRPARYFHLGADEYVMLASHPDCDEAWLASVDLETVRHLAERETLVPIERRACRWACGCTQGKILTALAPVAREDLAGLFGEEASIRVQCPRCAAAHVITREAMEAELARTEKA